MTDSPRADIPPSPNPSDPPDFWRMESKVFEELTCAVLDNEPDLKNADLFHVDGQSQYGIDSWADMQHTLAKAVASSKCYRTITPTQIEKWSNDFLDHYHSYWKARNVRRFILAVASLVQERRLSDQIIEERLRFDALGMEYEVWGPRQFQNKLRHQRGIVTQYMGNYWANVICGDVPVGANAVALDQGAVLGLLTTTVAPLLTALSAEIDSKLDSLRARLREESPRRIALELEKLRSSTHWSSITPNVRSKCLRYLASAKLQEGDVSAASALASEADTTLADGAVTFNALLTAHQGDLDRALRLLEHTSEPDAQELRAALLLQAGRLDDAERIIDELLLVEGESTVEASRLRAFLLLRREKRAAALAEIRRAEARKPRWFGVRRAGAIIRYANALSSVVGEEHSANPTPIAAEFVRQDDESQALLSEALVIFDGLVTECRESHTGFYDELWALACECNLVDGLSLAQVRCDRLLDADPASPEVISWALTRGLRFDQERSREALRLAAEASDRDASHVLAYSWLLTLDSNNLAAREILLPNRELFRNEAQRAAYQARMEFLDPSSVESVRPPVHDNASVERRIFTMISDVSDGVAWEHLESLFASLATRDARSVALLAAASRLAAAGRWKFLGRYVQLLTKFETASAIEIAVHAAFNTRNTTLALTVLEENRAAFPRNKFPRNLAVIEAHSLSEQGQHRQALKAAEALSSEFDGVRERMLPADIRLVFGDIRGALPVIRGEISKNDLPPDDALRWARVVALEDRDLARKLLKHAGAKGLPEEFAIEAHLQAQRLGMDREASVFESAIATLMAKSNDGRFKMMTFEEFREFQVTRAQTRFNLWNAYLDGALPFHVMAQPANIDFSERFYIGSSASQDTDEGPPLMIRHGARTVDFDTGIAFNDWRVFIDVSSLLLATQLEILDVLDFAVAAVIVPQCIQGQLIAFADSLEHPHPKTLEVESTIADALKTGAIGVWEKPHSAGSDVLPFGNSSEIWTVVNDSESESESVPDGDRNITLAAVIEGLRRSGQIDAVAFEQVVSDTGAIEADRPVPPLGARLHFREGTLGTLAFKCPLQAIVKTFVVLVDGEFATIVANNVHASHRRREVLKVVNKLREHIANKFLDGSYQTAKGRAEHAQHDEAAFSNYPVQIRGLLELLRCEPGTNAVFCCDDRFVSGYPRFGTAPVVGIYELLRALRKSHALSDKDYFAKLIRLRSANAMFLPLEAEEVLFHLKNAAIINGQVAETHELSVLRRYLARVALQECHLKVGDFPAIKSDRPDEVNILIMIRRLTDECLTIVWPSKSLTDKQCQAWATWVWSHLRVERPLGDHPSIKADRESLATVTAVTFSAALTTVVQLAVGHSKSRKAAYSQWLVNCAIRNRLNADKLLADHLVGQFMMLLDCVIAPDAAPRDKPYSDEAIAAYLRQAIDLLPTELRDRLLGDSKLQRSLKTKIVQVVHIGEIQLLRDRFIPAVRRAIQHGKSQAKAHESSDIVTFSSTEPPGSIAIKCKGKTAQIHDDSFLIFECRNETERRSFLEAHLAWFDRAHAEREAAMEAIVGIQSEVKQYDAIDEVRKQSLPFRYKEIEDQLDEGRSIPLAQFALGQPQQVFGHLRLESGSSPFSERWSIAADALLTECGLEEAFLRLGCLPVPLPQVFVERFVTSAPEVQRSAYARFAELAARSPIHFLHAFALLKAEDLPADVRALGSRMADDVLSRWNGLAGAMGSLLMWSETCAHDTQDWRGKTVEEQLVMAWYHAARLMCILNRDIDMQSQVRKHFAKARGSMSAEASFCGLTRFLDCASGNNFVDVVLLYRGMNYALYGAKSGSQLTEQQREKIMELTRVNNVVNPWLIASRELSPNCLDSFLSDHSITPAEAFALPATLSEDFENELIRAFESSPYNPMLWVHLYALARMGLCAANRSRFIEIVAGADFVQLAGLGSDGLVAWRSFAGCVRLLGESDTQETFKTQVRQFAQVLSDRYKGDETPINVNVANDRARRLNELLEACVTFSRSDDVAQAYDSAAELFLSVAAVWKTARTSIRAALEVMYDESRISENASVWNALVRLRAQT
ncbi:tetratricopeptide repeat protein [Burkholderia cepacia]|uniref:tetratricopeptide repeat protein n=1 Tax=Burkholderia cepacia TaxID=292 RepID=UPI000F5F1DF9|nr:tetratricopeptide repeat protein [Burkholderia cepacia]